MDLELSDGTMFNDVDRATLEKKIDILGSGTDHLILGDGDDFIQAAGVPGEMVVQYNTGTGMMESTSSRLDAATVKKMFLAFFEGDDGWQNLVPFQPMDGGAPQSTASGASEPMGTGRGSSSITDVNSLKAGILNSVKREAGNSIGYMVRRFIRRIFRGLF